MVKSRSTRSSVQMRHAVPLGHRHTSGAGVLDE
jgi:hypothetical protein